MNVSVTRDQFSHRLIVEMFQVSKGEEIAITVDASTDMDVVYSLEAAVKSQEAKPLIVRIPRAKGDGEMGMGDWPHRALTAALCEVDVWIEMTAEVMLYSPIWERALGTNKRLRYLVLGGSTLASLDRVFSGFDIAALGKLLRSIMNMAKDAKTVRVTSQNGTDVCYDIDNNFAFDIDDGDFSKPIFGTAPGYVNIVPKVGSMNGRIVFENLMNANVYDANGEVEFIMKDGRIDQVLGNDEAINFQKYLSSFDDPNMYKISHHMIGLNPGVRSLCGEIVEDERIWGGVDFGFGHTSPIDMPPHGQPAKSHFDGVVAKVDLYFDDMKIIDNGEVCHPDLVPLVNGLMIKRA